MPYTPDTHHLLRPASMELDALSPEEVIAPGSRLWEVFKAAYQAE